MSRSLAVFKWVFYINVIFLVLLSIPYLYTDPGPETRVITLFALVAIGIMLVGTALLTYFQSYLLDY